MRLKYKLAVISVMAVAIAACGKKAEDGDTAAAPEETEADDVDETGTLALALTPSAALGYLDAAVSSAMTATASGEKATGAVISAGALALSLIEVDQEASAADPKCSANGSPWDEETDALMERAHADYVGRVFYCAVNFNTFSPESVQGTYFLAKVIVCAAEKAGMEFTAEGKPQTITLLKTSECLPDIARDRLFEDGATEYEFSVSAKLAPEGGDWTHLVAIDPPEGAGLLDGGEGGGDEGGGDEGGGPGRMRLAIHSGKDFLAFRTVELDEAGGDTPGGYALSMDLANGIVRFDGALARINRHVRLLAKGDINAETGSFTTVKELTGIDTSSNYDLMTINGTRETGFVTQFFQAPAGDAAKDIDAATYETPTAKSCAAVSGTTCTAEGLGPKTADDLKYLKISEDFPTEQTALKAYKDTKPLTFDTVTFSVLP